MFRSKLPHHRIAAQKKRQAYSMREEVMLGIKGVTRLSALAALAITGYTAALPDRAAAEKPSPQPTACTQLPAKLLGGNIKYANAQIVPANTAPGPQFNNFTGTPPSSAKVPVS